MILLQILLFLIAWILILPLTIINFLLVQDKNYFKSTAKSIDIWANREFRKLWNTTLVNHEVISYNFGVENETISSALGKNQLLKSLSKRGKVLVFILDTIDKNHCEKAIINFK